MLTGLAWLVRGGRVPQPTVVTPRAPNRETLLAAAAHHRRAVAKCASTGEGRGEPIDKEELAQVLCNARRNTWQERTPTYPNDQDHNVARAAIEFFRSASAAAKSNTGGS
jgi:hypothetical protein